jgi:hypothetical protein
VTHLDCLVHVALVVANVLFARALERNLGRHEADIDADRVGGLDLVCAPLDLFLRDQRDNVRAALEKQRDAVGKAVHVNARRDAATANGDTGLDHKGVALEYARLGGKGGDQLGSHLGVHGDNEENHDMALCV